MSWREAEELDVQVMEIRKKTLGVEHPDTLASVETLALTFENQKRWKQAKGLHVQIVKTRKEILGEEHPDTLASIEKLWSMFWK